MRTFSDTKGRTWTVDLNLQVAYAFEQHKDEIREMLAKYSPDFAGVNISLLETTDEKFLQAITSTPMLLKLSWLCITCNPDNNPGLGEGITETEYLSGFKGNTVMEVKMLMMEELADFYPQMGTLFLKLKSAQEAAIANVMAVLEEVSPKLDSELRDLLREQREVFRKKVGLGETSG